MKDFDTERSLRPRRSIEERTFTLGGETFVAVDRFRPDVLTYLEDLPTEKTDPTTCSCSHRLHEHPAGACVAVGCQCKAFTAVVTREGASLSEQLAAFDRTIIEMIEGNGEASERYNRIRARNDDPLEIGDLLAVVKWMTSADTARPTGAPSVSSPGRGPTGITSTESSSSPETTAG